MEMEAEEEGTVPEWSLLPPQHDTSPLNKGMQELTKENQHLKAVIESLRGELREERHRYEQNAARHDNDMWRLEKELVLKKTQCEELMRRLEVLEQTNKMLHIEKNAMLHDRHHSRQDNEVRKGDHPNVETGTSEMEKAVAMETGGGEQIRGAEHDGRSLNQSGDNLQRKDTVAMEIPERSDDDSAMLQTSSGGTNPSSARIGQSTLIKERKRKACQPEPPEEDEKCPRRSERIMQKVEILNKCCVEYDSGFPLMNIASQGNGKKLTDLILEGEVDLNEQNNDGWTALHAAVFSGDEKMAEILCCWDVDINLTTNDGWTPLIAASSHGYSGMVRLLIEFGANLNAKTCEGWTALISAANSGNIEAVKILHEASANINEPSHVGLTALFVACQFGEYQIAEYLIENDAVLDVVTESNWTPIFAASHFGHIEIVQLLITKKCAIDVVTADGSTALHAAAERGYHGIMKCLMNAGANIFTEDFDGQTPVYLAARNGHFECLKLLVSKAPTRILDWEFTNGCSLMHLVAQSGSVECIEGLVKYEMPLNCVDRFGRTPLHYAALHGHASVIETLLEHGASPGKRNTDDNLPLHLAAFQLVEKSVKILMDCTEDVKARNKYGWTALHCAAEVGCVESVGKLKKAYNEIDVLNEFNQTPLHLACREGHKDVVSFLVSDNNVMIEDIDRRIPLHYAARGGHTDIFLMLISRKPESINAVDLYGMSALHFAASQLNTDAVEALLSLGADINSTCNNGQTALHIICAAKADDTAQYHLNRNADGGPGQPDDKLANLAAILISRDIKINTTENQQRSALHIAVMNEKWALAHLLLDERGINVKLADDQGRTAVHYAVQAENHSIARRCLDRGASINVGDKQGMRPLHLAASIGNPEIIMLLIQRGANINCRDKDDLIPFHHAAIQGHTRVTSSMLNVHPDRENLQSLARNIIRPTHKKVLQHLHGCRDKDLREVLPLASLTKEKIQILGNWYRALLESKLKFDFLSFLHGGYMPKLPDDADFSFAPVRHVSVSEAEKRHQQEKHVYVMNSDPRGRAIILNIQKFDNFEERKGAPKDQLLLERALTQLGFDVVTWKGDLTAQGIHDKIEEERGSGRHRYHSAFVFAMLSHGCAFDYIFGSDGKKDKTGGLHIHTEIMSKFDRWNCEALRDKPKIFIIQICRGSAEAHRPGDRLVPVRVGPEAGQIFSFQSPPISPIVRSQQPQEMVLSPRLLPGIDHYCVPRDAPLLPGQVHRDADIITIHSTLPYYKAYHNHRHGSWYIEELVLFLELYAHEKPLCEIARLARQLLQHREGSDYSTVQASEWTTNAPKKLYFLPGFKARGQESRDMDTN